MRKLYWIVSVVTALAIGLVYAVWAEGPYWQPGDPVIITSGNLEVGESGTPGELSLWDGSANTVGIDAPSTGTNWTLTLPTGPGTNTYALTTDGSGNTDWTPVAGGAAAPIDAPYMVQAFDGTLTAERRLVAGDGLTSTDGGANGDWTIKLDPNGANNQAVRWDGTGELQSSWLNIADTPGLGGGLTIGDGSANVYLIFDATGSTNPVWAVSSGTQWLNLNSDDVDTVINGDTGAIVHVNAGGMFADIKKLQVASAYYLPDADGSANQFIKTDGAGSWGYGSIGGAGGVASSDIPFVTIGAQAGLTAERALATGAGLSMSDGGANGAVTISSVVSRNVAGYIYPTTANDFVSVSTNLTEAILAGNTGAGDGVSASAAGAGYGVDADSSSGIGVRGQTSTGVAGVWGNNAGTGDGVVGYSVNGSGVLGSNGNSANDEYGGAFSRTRLGSWADVTVQATIPADPPSGECRICPSDDNDASRPRPYALDDSGNVIQLAAPTVIQATANLLCPEDGTVTSGRYVVVAAYTTASPATVTCTPSITVVGSTKIGECSATFSWTPTTSEEELQNQSQVICGFPFRRQGDLLDASCRAVVKARIKINKAECFDDIKLVLNDVGPTDDTPVYGANASVLSSLTDGNWAEVTLAAAGTDISSWGADLRAGLMAIGTSDAGSASATSISVERIWVEMYQN